MQKVDRLGWTAGISFKAYGTRFDIRVNDADVLDRIPEYLPLGWEADDSPTVDFLYSLLAGGPGERKGIRRYNLLYAGSGRIVRTMDLDEIFSGLEAHLELQAALLAKGCLFVHAGVVGWQGRAIVIPGRSFTGKTSLVAALVKAGASYYSDEFAIFDPQGRVHPYPRLLSIRSESNRVGEKYSVEELGGQTGVEPLPVGLVVMTEYQAGARWQPRKLTPARAMLDLMNNTVAAHKEPQHSIPVLKEVIAGATIIKSKRGEAEEVIAPLLNMISNNNN